MSLTSGKDDRKNELAQIPKGLPWKLAMSNEQKSGQARVSEW